MSHVYSFDYNTAYDPPAPFIPITVDGHDPTSNPVTITAFVDSGADGTMLPIDVLQAVGAEYEASLWLRGTTGSRQRVDSYTVSIHIETETVYAISAVALPAGSATADWTRRAQSVGGHTQWASRCDGSRATLKVQCLEI